MRIARKTYRPQLWGRRALLLLGGLVLAVLLGGLYAFASEQLPQWAGGLFRLDATHLLALEMPLAQGVDFTAFAEDPYWELEDESTDPDSTIAQQTPPIDGVIIDDPSAGDADWPLPLIPTQTSADALPEILLYCTHSNESYKKLNDQAYEELPNTRTMDRDYNILSIAQTLATHMRDTHGLPVLFDDTDHELGKYYSISYERSLETIKQRQAEYDSLKVFLDIHRDATSEEAGKDDFVTIDGEPCAKIMIVVGTGEGQTGAGFSDRPDWEKNKQFADALTAKLEEIAPGITRPVRVKTGRYNQHISAGGSLAIEIGHNRNTRQQVLNSTPYLAQALALVLGE